MIKIKSVVTTFFLLFALMGCDDDDDDKKHQAVDENKSIPFEILDFRWRSNSNLLTTTFNNPITEITVEGEASGVWEMNLLSVQKIAHFNFKDQGSLANEFSDIITISVKAGDDVYTETFNVFITSEEKTVIASNIDNDYRLLVLVRKFDTVINEVKRTISITADETNPDDNNYAFVFMPQINQYKTQTEVVPSLKTTVISPLLNLSIVNFHGTEQAITQTTDHKTVVDYSSRNEGSAKITEANGDEATIGIFNSNAIVISTNDDIVTMSDAEDYVFSITGGNDEITLKDGDDWLEIMPGNAQDGELMTVDGGHGYDTVSLFYLSKGYHNSRLTLQEETEEEFSKGTIFFDEFTGYSIHMEGIENLIGGGSNDTLIGDENSNWLVGHDGNDRLDTGNDGADFMIGGAGEDTFVLSYDLSKNGLAIIYDCNTAQNDKIDVTAIVAQEPDVYFDGSFIKAGSQIIAEDESLDHCDENDFITVRNYIVGDIGQAGGTVFYVDENYAYEAAANDLPEKHPYGCSGTDIATIDPDTTLSIDGRANTAAIIAASCNLSTSAASVVSAHWENRYFDWFLPSLLELKELYSRKDIIDGLNGKFYLSSNQSPEQTDNQAVKVDIDTGKAFWANKMTPFTVRPIRRFVNVPTALPIK